MKKILTFPYILLTIVNAQTLNNNFPLEIGNKWFIAHSFSSTTFNYYVIQIDRDTILGDGLSYAELVSYDLNESLQTRIYYRKSENKVIEYPDKVILDYNWNVGDTADWTSGVTIGMVEWNGKYPVNPTGDGFRVGSYSLANQFCLFNINTGFNVLYHYNYWAGHDFSVVGTIINEDTSGYVFGFKPKPIVPLKGSFQTLPITFKWSKSSGAYMYEMQLSHDSTFTSQINYYSNNDTLVTLNQLDTNSVNYWRVKALYDQNVWGPFSSVYSFYISGSTSCCK